MRHTELQEFVAATLTVDSFRALDTLMNDATRRLGFQHFALVHHVSVRGAPQRFVQLSSYPESWIAHHVSNNLLTADPIVAACQRTATSFAWSQLDRVVRLHPRQHEILEQAQRHGLANGFSVPIHIPGDPPGSANFVVRPGRAMPEDHFAQAHYLATFAFEAGRRLREASSGPLAPVRLSPRQIDCIILVARGKTDVESGLILGIGRDTVHQHIEAAKARLGVATRAQLIVAALHRQVIALHEVTT